MTSNMINYRKLEEDRRHNREMERLTGESQAETARHQRVVEEETARTNVANEAIKTQQNVINDNHYGRQDYETARHNVVSEYYTLQQPASYGKAEADVALTKSQTGLNAAKSKESLAKAEESISKVPVNQTNAALNKAKYVETLASADLKDVQRLRETAETRLTETKTLYYPDESISRTVKNYTGAVGDLLNAFSKTVGGLNYGKTIINR